jgi:hypothetical protein
MGELGYGTGTSPEQDATVATHDKGSVEPGKIATDVDDIFADGMKQDLPVFDVETDDFYNNLRADRQRLRFKSSDAITQYMQKTRYNRPFWVRTKDGNYMRKVK